MNKSLFNFLQISRGLLRLQPLGCLEPVSPCYCKGCDDDQFDSCDDPSARTAA